MNQLLQVTALQKLGDDADRLIFVVDEHSLQLHDVAVVSLQHRVRTGTGQDSSERDRRGTPQLVLLTVDRHFVIQKNQTSRYLKQEGQLGQEGFGIVLIRMNLINQYELSINVTQWAGVHTYLTATGLERQMPFQT